MAGGAVEMLLVSLICPLPLLGTLPPSLLVCFFFVSQRRESGRLEVNLFLSEKRGEKTHFGKILVSAVLGISTFCIASRSLLPSASMQTKQDPREPALLRDF
jgi:hypothetical protein